MPNQTVLVLDDSRQQAELVSDILGRAGYRALPFSHPGQALEELKGAFFHLVLTDLSMPEMSGMQVLHEARQISPETAVVIMTAFGTIENAVEAIKVGAADYLTKPFSTDQLLLTVDRVLKGQQVVMENRLLKERLEASGRDEFDLVGNHPSMLRIKELIQRVAQDSRTPVLIMGESGTGKELAARAIHRLSARCDNPFIAVNCAALPVGLLESELFGHEKGSFTGAASRRLGRFMLADSGTLFLDEIGEMDMSMQSKLLRVLQEGEFMMVGGTRPQHVDVRVISATNRNLPQEVLCGRFREDLYYRLNVIPITLPPLRERTSDLQPLVDCFRQQYWRRHGRKAPGLTPAAQAALQGYSFPGNVRELFNLLERGSLLAHGPEIEAEDLSVPCLPASSGTQLSLREAGEEAQRQTLLEALARHDWNQRLTSAALGISERTLRYRLQRYGLRKPRG
jgi:two-component system NtrC family response regulator